MEERIEELKSLGYMEVTYDQIKDNIIDIPYAGDNGDLGYKIRWVVYDYKNNHGNRVCGAFSLEYERCYKKITIPAGFWSGEKVLREEIEGGGIWVQKDLEIFFRNPFEEPIKKDNPIISIRDKIIKGKAIPGSAGPLMVSNGGIDFMESNECCKK